MVSKLRRGLLPVLSALSGRPREAESPGAIPVTEVELFDILADNRRRSVIRQLAEPGDRRWVPTAELAMAVASAELHMPESAVPDSRVDEVAAELEETHLPRLADIAIVRWDEAAEMVATGPSLGPVADWLARVDRHLESSTPGHRYHRRERWRRIG